MSSYHFRSIFARSRGTVLRKALKASAAALMAVFVSSTESSGTEAIGLVDAGSVTSKVLPEEA